MLKERLLSPEFYLDHLSLFMKDSYGIKERLDTYLAILNNVDNISNEIISRFDIYNKFNWEKPDYFTRNNITLDSTDDKWLDLIGNIFNIKRIMNITYYNTVAAFGNIGDYINETITLTNRELYLYIKVMISKLNYQGTREEIENLYGKPYIDPTKDDTSLEGLGIKYYWDTSAECSVYLSSTNATDNIKKLFLADKFIIESLGITYTKTILSGSTFEIGKFGTAEFYINGQSTIYVFK